jgi:hypothetical protein
MQVFAERLLPLPAAVSNPIPQVKLTYTGAIPAAHLLASAQEVISMTMHLPPRNCCISGLHTLVDRNLYSMDVAPTGFIT